jgi:predicted permease
MMLLRTKHNGTGIARSRSMTVDHLWNDVRFASRQFAKRPGLTAAALLALACGLGAVITVFTLVDAVILRPLPVSKPHELVSLRDPSFSFPVFEEVGARADMLSRLFAWVPWRLEVQWTNEIEQTQALLATGGIHETLGLAPAAGRLLAPSDSGRSAEDAQAVAVLSYSAWKRRFDADPAVIGRTLRIEGTPFTIVGVTPPSFTGVAVGLPPEVTIPVTMLPRLRQDEARWLTNPSRSWLYIMGRLKPGWSVESADAAFQPIWQHILRATSSGIDAGFLPRYMKFTSGWDPGVSGFSPVRRQFREALWLLFGLVGLLLVAACATVGNLLLAGAAARRNELGLRLALGAARRRIAQQLFVEGLLLAAAGGLLGFLFSTWAADLLVRLLSTSYESVVVTLTPDRRVLLFIASVVAVTTAVFTLAPIVSASRIEPGCMLDPGGRQTGSPRRGRAARALVAVQVAISLTLLAGSALFVRNLSQLLATDLGFERENLLVVSVNAMSPLSVTSRGTPGTPDRLPYYDDLLRRLRETPGVKSASLSRKPPISNELGSWWDVFAADDGRTLANPSDRTYLNAVSPGYFDTLGLPIAAGRDFTLSDRDGAPRVAIINVSLARAYFGYDSPIGRHLLMGRKPIRLEVIGVVRDATYQNLVESRRRIAYLPYRQVPEILRDDNLVADVRVAGSLTAVAESIRAMVRTVDPIAPLTIQSVENRVDESLVRERLITVIAAFLGAVALLLACGALGGVMSHLVTARTREIGVRLALGAERRSVLTLVMRQALAVAALGAIAGLAMTLAAGRLVSRFLSAISPADPWALSAAAVVLLATAALASYLPARRASRVDPMTALRFE